MRLAGGLALAAALLAAGECRSLRQREGRGIDCAEHSTPELCKKATDWGLCRGWLKGTCIEKDAGCSVLKTELDCLHSMDLMGVKCRGWGGSFCLGKENNCSAITDEATCLFAQANLALPCTDWDGSLCHQPNEKTFEELEAIRKKKEFVKARVELRRQREVEKQQKQEKAQRQLESAQRRARQADEKKRLEEEANVAAAKQAIKDRRNQRLQGIKDKADSAAKAEEDAKRQAQEDFDREKLEAKAKRDAEAEEARQAEDAQAEARVREEKVRQAKYGTELWLTVSASTGGDSVDIKTRQGSRLRVLLNAARTRLGLGDDFSVLMARGQALDLSKTPQEAGLSNKDVVTVSMPKQ